MQVVMYPLSCPESHFFAKLNWSKLPRKLPRKVSDVLRKCSFQEQASYSFYQVAMISSRYLLWTAFATTIPVSLPFAKVPALGSRTDDAQHGYGI
jgi:hypothetical protein